MNENEDQEQDAENEHMSARKALHDSINEQLKTIPNYEEAIVTGWVLLVEIKAPNDREDSIGPLEDIYGLASDLNGDQDPAPWTVKGWLHEVLFNYEEYFFQLEKDEED